MNYVLFDDPGRTSLFPFTYTCTAADLLIGAFTNRRRWETVLGKKVSTITSGHLSALFPSITKKDNTFINARLLPSRPLLKEIGKLAVGQKLLSQNVVLAARASAEAIAAQGPGRNGNLQIDALTASMEAVELSQEASLIDNVWDFFAKNGDILKSDLKMMDLSAFSRKSGKANTAIGKDVYIHRKASIYGVIMNSEEGPVIIDEGALVMEGSCLRGPIYIGKNAVVKMGAKIYGPTSIGNYAKVGGEINNSVINDFSNKAHDGYLGNSVVGRWCNIGADSNTSNLKNDYSTVKLWNYTRESFVNTGLQFLGLIMGDHSKCGINTMFNTGTVVGVSCNLYGAGYHNNFVPSFSWGKPGAYATYEVSKALKVAKTVMGRRGIELSSGDESVLKAVFDESQALREKFNKVA